MPSSPASETNEREVVLVDERGRALGTSGKLAAHRSPGSLHLAFSVVLYRPDGRTLLQQRAATKYHFPLAWANACCSHPVPGQEVVVAAEERLWEEVGIRCQLSDVGTVTYRAECSMSGLVEHEFDHVLVGVTESEPRINPEEVAAVRWVMPRQVIDAPPGNLAPWLEKVLEVAESARIELADGPEGRSK
jgi:isopentenyl-diphosphate Delta-isomerase